MTKAKFIFITTILVLANIKSFSQTETEKIIQAVINYDKLLEEEYIVCEYLEDLKDSSYNDWIKQYKLSLVENIIYIQPKSISIRLISRSSIIELEGISKKLNRLTDLEKGSESVYLKTNSYKLIFDIFDRKLCQFYKVYFSHDKKYALVKYEIIHGCSGFGNSSATRIMQKKNGIWIDTDEIEIEES